LVPGLKTFKLAKAVYRRCQNCSTKTDSFQK